MPDTATLEKSTSEVKGFAFPSTQAADRLITVLEFSKRYGLSKVNVYTLIRHGKIPAVHLGRSIRISERVLDNWIASGGCR